MLNSSSSKSWLLARVVAVLSICIAALGPMALPVSATCDPAAMTATVDSHCQGWGITGSNGGNNYSPLGAAPRACDPAYHTVTLASGEYVIFDLGASYTIGNVYGSWTFDATMHSSENGTDWTSRYTWGAQSITSCGYNGRKTGTLGFSARYLKFIAPAGYCCGGRVFRGIKVEVSGGPTPTPTPTATITATATAIPSATQFATATLACVSASATPTATSQRTPTPFSMTPTPGSIYTPTATPNPNWESGTANFATGLSPWTTYNNNILYGSATWLSGTLGYDGAAGVVYEENLGINFHASSPLLLSTGVFSNVVLYSKPSGMPTPLQLSGNVKWDGSLYAGETVRLGVAYLAPNEINPTQLEWWLYSTEANAPRVGSFWQKFSIWFEPDEAVQVRAVAVVYEIDGANHVHTGQGLLLDDLRLGTGPAGQYVGLPICAGSGAGNPDGGAGGSGSNPRAQPPKVCRIAWNTIDVYADCAIPVSAWDIIDWVAYWFCRLWDYFEFNSLNRNQIEDLSNRQRANEPLGTTLEITDAFWVVYDTVQSIQAVYAGTDYGYEFDFNSLLNWSAIDTPPTLELQSDNAYMARCNTLILNVSVNAQRSACFVVDSIRTKFVFLVVAQWALNIAALITALLYVSKKWFATA